MRRDGWKKCENKYVSVVVITKLLVNEVSLSWWYYSLLPYFHNIFLLGMNCVTRGWFENWGSNYFCRDESETRLLNYLRWESWTHCVHVHSLCNKYLSISCRCKLTGQVFTMIWCWSNSLPTWLQSCIHFLVKIPWYNRLSSMGEQWDTKFPKFHGTFLLTKFLPFFNAPILNIFYDKILSRDLHHEGIKKFSRSENHPQFLVTKFINKFQFF